ncbi:hypothetical protein [Streptomyces sp. NRRL F-5135]|uniref:hypothetical protein n=1 Tax=Streptomyces sp. NRRL F-5135 TaxID=1463858 RepID=UPI000690C5F6|nr:hypothetical protein [Streptomyces sp. NRRL F-5135]
MGHRLSGTDRIAYEHELLVNLSGLMANGRGEDDLQGHAHQWVPFAHPNDGGVAFIDHRPGPTYGRVYEMGIGSGAVEAATWGASLTELFDALATSLYTGEPFRGDWPDPYELPSGHFHLSWVGSNRTKMASMQDWPPPQRLDSPLQPAPATGRKLGRSLGALIVPS